MKTIFATKRVHALNVIFGFSIAALLASCSSPSTPSAPPTWVIPKAGSVFAFMDSEFDSLGTPLNSEQETDSVLATGLQIDGMSNVIGMDEKVSGRDDGEFYFAYLTNGDIALGDTDLTKGGYMWDQFPTGSQKRIVHDSSYIGGFRNQTISYAGTETIEIGNQNFNTIKVSITIDETDTTNVTDVDLSHAVETAWFAPSLGYLVKFELRDTDSSSDTPGEWNTETSEYLTTLEWYTLK